MKTAAKTGVKSVKKTSGVTEKTVKKVAKKTESAKAAKKPAAPVKKAPPAKKAPAKPAPAKKAPVKKTPAKPAPKAPVKKAPAKPVAKPAPVKKAEPVKKTAPKASVKKAAPAKKPAPAKKVPAKPVAKPVAKPAAKPAPQASAKPVAKPAPAVKKGKPGMAAAVRTELHIKKVKMSKAEKKFFHDLLMKERAKFGEQLKFHADEALTSRKDSGAGRAGMATHMADLGSDNFRHDFELGLLSGEADVMEMIDEALQRLEDSEYGVCLDCGEKIARERMIAKPYAKYCTRCKSLRESTEDGFRRR